MRLVLWDIDGTLVESAKLGRDAFFEAFEAVVGHEPRQLVPFAGRTDLEIAHDMLREAGVEAADELLDSFARELAAAMKRLEPDLRVRGQALPGAGAALDRLAAEDGVLQSLLTGNIEPNAHVKLGAFGLDRHLDFEIGAYGSDHHVRGELVAIALAKARRKHGLELDASHTVLIGDTPLDVRAAREGGARAVAVATGPHNEEELHASGADVVLADLRDTEAVLAALLG